MAKRKHELIDATAAFQTPTLADVALLPDMNMILEGLAAAAVQSRQQTQLAEQRFNTYVAQCADKLGVNTPRYQFDATKRAFVQNETFKEGQ